MQKMWIKIDNWEQCKSVQEALFKLGYKWASGDTKVWGDGQAIAEIHLNQFEDFEITKTGYHPSPYSAKKDEEYKIVDGKLVPANVVLVKVEVPEVVKDLVRDKLETVLRELADRVKNGHKPLNAEVLGNLQQLNDFLI